MKMKKICAMVLTGVVIMGMLAGCGSSESSESSGSGSKKESSSANTSTDSDSSAASTKASGKILVAYYSATGSTKAVAETIADTTGGDLFELEPTEPYANADLNWSNDDSRVSREHDNEDERDVELVNTTVDNWDEYDTVFIGYPKMEYSL